jgi:arylsulfatase A-like enzyme
LHRWLAARKPDQPFFVYLHLMDVHGPYVAPEQDYAAVRDSAGLGPARKLTPEETSRLPYYLVTAPWVKDGGADELRTWRGRYAAGVHALDRQLGPFLAELGRSGALADAIVVLTADHGEELGDNGGWDHGHQLYDNQLHVPLLVRMPRGAGGGRHVAEIVSLIDLMPTLLAQARIPAPSEVQGHDLSPLLRGDAGSGDSVSFANGVKWDPALHSLRAPGWKLIRDGSSGPASLFDLTVDPGEQHDVAAARPHELEELECTLAAHQQALAALPALQAARGAVSDEMRKRLESLGYTR